MKNLYDQILEIKDEISKIKCLVEEKKPQVWEEWVPTHKLTQKLGWSNQTLNRWLHGKHPNETFNKLAPLKKKKILGSWWVHTSEVEKLFKD